MTSPAFIGWRILRLSIFHSDLFWPVSLVAVAVAAVILGGGAMLVGQVDDAARSREQGVVEAGLSGRLDDIAARTSRSPATPAALAGLTGPDGPQTAMLMDPSGQPISASLAPSAGLVRAAAALARSMARTGAADARVVGVVGGTPTVLFAHRAADAGPRSPVVVAAASLDQEFLSDLARRLRVNAIHVRPAASAQAAGEARLVLRDDHDRRVAVLGWSADRPSRALLARLILPGLWLIVGFGLATLLLLHRARRLTQGRMASEARAVHLAFHDALTGLPNRTLFFDRLGHALEQMRRRPQTIAVHCIDLDRFKEVNDTFGHHVGDELIREAAHRMAAQCRASDTFARLSGDEFAIVQTDATPATAAILAARLVEVMNQPIQLGSGRMFSGCSIGVSMIEDGSVEPAEALRQADLALYRAKANGRLQFCFFELEMDAAVKTRRSLENDLREALARDELQMAYQPQVDRNGMMTGVEALVRWTHPVRGPVAPNFFIPIAEECGLIVELGMFTIRRAFEDSRRWKGLRIAINVSAVQMRMKDFVDRVAELVRELDVDPRRFELEITEGILLGDDPATLQTLTRLRGMGFSLALDDFGAGYSSLSYLQRYPISKIKIDRAFIANLGVDAEADGVVGAIVKLARALRLSVIAEGVETTDQRARLASAGCSTIQGFLFSRAVPAGEIDAMVAGGAQLLETPVGS